jgi:hypothetical protein
VDELYREALAAGPSVPRIRELLARAEPDDTVLLALLRRPLPVAFLSHLGSARPWSERPRVLGGVALNPRSPRPLVLKVLPALFWRDLADVAASLRLAPAVRFRAESLLQESLPDLRLGDRISLARLATAAVLRPLLADADAKVVSAALRNPRLREAELVLALQQGTTSQVLIAEAAACSRWTDSYAVRLALVLQPRSPLSVSLGQLTSLTRRDLVRIAETPSLPPLVQASARRLADS